MEKPKTPKHVPQVARRLRTNGIEAEAIVWEALRNRQLAGSKFRRQHPLGRYIADFYCHEALLVVELDGSVHDDADQAEYDELRQKEIEERGLTVLRLKNEEVIRSLATSLEIITEVLKTS